MSRFRFSSLRVRLQVLIWVAVIPVLLLIIGSSIWYRHHKQAEIRDKVFGLVNLEKQGLDRYINDTRLLLLTISSTDVMQEGSPSSISDFFSNMHQHFPEHTNFGAVDLEGNVFASAVPLKKPVNASDKFWFQQTMKSREFTIGEYQIGRVTGREVIVFGQPVFDRAGNLKFLLFTAMDIRWLNRLWTSGTILFPDSTFIVADRHGTVLSRLPDPEKWAGKDMREAGLVREMLTRREGACEIEGLDGIKRFYAFTTTGTPESSIHLAVGVSSKAAFSHANNMFAANLIVLALVAVFGLSLARCYSNKFITNPLAVLQDATVRFLSGNYTTRVNLSDGDNELIGYSKMFDQMAETIEKNTEDLRLFRELIDKSNDAIFIVDTETGRIVDVNEKACSSTAYSREELLNMHVMDVDAITTEHSLWKDHVEEVREKRDIIFVSTHRRKDGTTFPVELNVRYVSFDESSYIIGIARDITERKKDEAGQQAFMRLSEYALSHALDDLLTKIIDEIELLTGSKIGFFHFLEEDQKTLWLQSWSTNTLRNMCTAAGKDRHYPIEEAGVWADAVRLRKPLIHNDYAALPNRKGLPDGHAQVIREVVVPIIRGDLVAGIIGVGNKSSEYSGRDVEVISWVGNVAWEIVLAKRAENERRKSEDLMKNILESVGEGFVVIDPEYKIISANKAYCEQAKRCCEDIVGRHCYEVSHHLEKPCFMADEECAPRHTFKTGVPHMAIHTHYAKDGSSIYLETKSFPMKDSSGKVFAVIETLNNITEKRMLEDQLRHAQKMEAIGTLAGGIAHDFNNILNVIIGYGGLMQMDMSSDDPQMSHLKEILAAGDRAAQLTKGLLTFSRKHVMEIRIVNLKEIVEGFQKMLTRIIGEDIDLKIRLSEKSLPVKADIVQLEQILMNLAANARDAMPKGGVLSIETCPVTIDGDFIKMHGYGTPGQYALITVSDTGIGMDEKTRERIFEPYFTTKEQGKGTGLGLAIVYGIVAQHNGYLHCYSEPGKGTTFRIYIPLVKSEAEQLEKVEPVVPKGGTETILIAEDDANVRSFIRHALESYGYTLIEAVDGNDAVEKFKANKDKIQLILFDLIMPGKNGKVAYEDIKGIRHDVKAIFMSGYARDIILKSGIEEGIEFISKPLLPSELLRKVRGVLDR